MNIKRSKLQYRYYELTLSDYLLVVRMTLFRRLRKSHLIRHQTSFFPHSQNCSILFHIHSLYYFHVFPRYFIFMCLHLQNKEFDFIPVLLHSIGIKRIQRFSSLRFRQSYFKNRFSCRLKFCLHQTNSIHSTLDRLEQEKIIVFFVLILNNY
jgi:hypothetical protein